MRQSLLWMLNDLESTRLEVCKYPGRHGGYVRVVVSSNCEWYRQLCRNYVRPRKRYPKPRTIIRRQVTVKAIQRMLRGNLCGVYAERILDVMQELRIPTGGGANGDD